MIVTTGLRGHDNRVFWTTSLLDSATARKLQDFCDALPAGSRRWTYGRSERDANGVARHWFYAWGEAAPVLPEGW